MQIQCHKHHMSLSGDITVNSVTGAIFKQFVNDLKNNEVNEIDLTGVMHADSTCVSLFIAARRNRDNASMVFTNIPKAVVALIDLYELDDWIQ